MGRKNDLQILPGDVRKGLFNLRRMPMLTDGIRGDAFVAFDEVTRHFQSPSRPGNAALAVDQDIGQLNVVAGHEGRQSEDRGLGIAARIGDQLSRDDFLTIQFWQSIDSLGKVCQISVAMAVPLRINVGVAETIVGAKVDYPHPELENSV